MEGLWAGEGDVRGSPGDRDGPEGASGAGRGAEGLGALEGLAAAGLVAAGLVAVEATAALPGLGAVGGPRGLGDTGGGARFVSAVENNREAITHTSVLSHE